MNTRLARLDNGDFDDPDHAQSVIQQIHDEPASNRGEVIKLVMGCRYEQRFYPLDWMGSTLPPGIKQKGVYVILGGSGSIGRAVTRSLIDRYQAEVVWIGRSPATDSKIQQRLAEFAPSPPIYVQGDVTDQASMDRAVQHILAQCGTVNGAIFSGMVLIWIIQFGTPMSQLSSIS